MFDLIIVGAGPRGIGLALQAIERSLSVLIIDPEPLSTWRNIPIDINMRSPIGFDLVSFMPEYRQYSLSTYLGSYQEFNNQEDIERSTSVVTRQHFINYMEFMWSRVLSICSYKQDKVINIWPNKVMTTKEVYRGKNVVIAYSPIKAKNPNWLNLELKRKLVTAKDIDSINNSLIWVIGSGQSAAEYVYSLCSKGNTVYWFNKKTPRVDQYPAPSYNHWGYKSALGPYYRSIKENKEAAMRYMKDIKRWQPSITPDIDTKLSTVKDRYKVILDNPSSIEVNMDYIFLCNGVNSSVDLVPLALPVDRHIYNNDLPLLHTGFRSSLSNERSGGKGGYIFTGLLASLYDGPRQGSLISIGLTSKEILDNINL
jgi:hypothetical protein